MTNPHRPFPPRQFQELMAYVRHLSGWSHQMEPSWPAAWAGAPTAPVQAAEVNDTLRPLLTSSIDDEATAAAFYATIADALREEGLEQAANWVRDAGRDEEKHRTLLQRRFRQLYGTTHQPVIGTTTVEDLATALTEALADEFTDSRKYRDAYLAYPDPADQRLFFELMTDEMRHSTVFTYALQTLR